MTQSIIILGSVGNCIDILDTIREINTSSENDMFNCIGFLDDNPDKWPQLIHGIPVLGPLERARTLLNCMFVNGIGSPANYLKKSEIITKTQIPIDRFANVIHPSACVSKMANLGKGVVIFQNVTVTSNAQIGNHVILLPNSVVSHDTIIGDYTCVAGSVCISGSVTIGKSCYIGANSSIIEGCRIGDGCLIGMGSVVLDDVPENTVVVGNPAHYLRNAEGI